MSLFLSKLKAEQAKAAAAAEKKTAKSKKGKAKSVKTEGGGASVPRSADAGGPETPPAA
jgi:hypothetical protein